MTLPFEPPSLSLPSAGNPILDRKPFPEADVAGLTGPATIRQRRADATRTLRDARRTETAAEAIAGFDHGHSIYGFTKGQFSLIDLLDAALEVTGPADLSISTWTAAGQDVTRVLQFIEGRTVLSARWLVDLSFCRRTPALAARIRSAFGDDAIRVAKNHAKFLLIRNAQWSVVVETSMNLNHNPRFENFRITHDEELADFLSHLLDEIWTRQERRLSDRTVAEIGRHFSQDI